MTRRPPRPTLFPYPTLFRSAGENEAPSSPGPGTDSSMAPSADTKTPPADDPEARRREERLYADLEIQQLFNRSEEHTSELQSQSNLVCRLLLEKKKKHLSSDRTTTAIQSYSSTPSLACAICTDLLQPSLCLR